MFKARRLNANQLKEASQEQLVELALDGVSDAVEELSRRLTWQAGAILEQKQQAEKLEAENKRLKESLDSEIAGEQALSNQLAASDRERIVLSRQVAELGAKLADRDADYKDAVTSLTREKHFREANERAIEIITDRLLWAQGAR